MARIVIVTGPPGSGKTTLATRLAAGRERGVHLRGDAFFAFVARPIPPVLREAHAQNETVIRATLRAAAAFAAGGYDVFLDGIFGPWFLPVVADELLPGGLAVEYAVLRVSLARARERATSRPNDPAPAAVVEQMHAAFASLGELEQHVLEVEHLGVEDAVRLFSLRSEAGRLALDLGRWRAPR